jgi:glycosyltransferase involved in cell wall biosynthesis
MKVLIVTLKPLIDENADGVSKIGCNLLKLSSANTVYKNLSLRHLTTNFSYLLHLLSYIFIGKGGIQDWVKSKFFKELNSKINSCHEDYDVIHFMGASFALMWPLLSNEVKNKSLLNLIDNGIIHSKRHAYKKGTPFYILKKIECYKKLKAYSRLSGAEVSFVSKRDARYFQLLTGIKAYTVENGINLPEFPKHKYSINKDAISLVFHGDLTYKPNIEALRVIDKICNPMLKCYAIGRVSKSMTNECQNICFLGFVDDLYAELRKYDLYICPIQSGAGIKNKIIEAAGIGLPIIATRESVIGTGLKAELDYFEAQSVEDFTKKIIGLASNPQLSETVAISARTYVQNRLTWDVTANKYERIYKRIKQPHVF